MSFPLVFSKKNGKTLSRYSISTKNSLRDGFNITFDRNSNLSRYNNEQRHGIVITLIETVGRAKMITGGLRNME